MNENINSFGKRIKELREARNLLLRKVASAIDLDPSLLSKYENGVLFPNIIVVQKLADFYNISLDELKTLLYADKIMLEYGNYKFADNVLNLLRERITKYGINQEDKKE